MFWTLVCMIVVGVIATIGSYEFQKSFVHIAAAPCTILHVQLIDAGTCRLCKPFPAVDGSQDCSDVSHSAAVVTTTFRPDGWRKNVTSAVWFCKDLAGPITVDPCSVDPMWSFDQYYQDQQFAYPRGFETCSTASVARAVGMHVNGGSDKTCYYNTLGPATHSVYFSEPPVALAIQDWVFTDNPSFWSFAPLAVILPVLAMFCCLWTEGFELLASGVAAPAG